MMESKLSSGQSLFSYISQDRVQEGVDTVIHVVIHVIVRPIRVNISILYGMLCLGRKTYQRVR